MRVRRDANEQMVLAHVSNRLSPLVSQLTVQVILVFKQLQLTVVVLITWLSVRMIWSLIFWTAKSGCVANSSPPLRCFFIAVFLSATPRRFVFLILYFQHLFEYF